MIREAQSYTNVDTQTLRAKPTQDRCYRFHVTPFPPSFPLPPPSSCFLLLAALSPFLFFLLRILFRLLFYYIIPPFFSYHSCLSSFYHLFPLFPTYYAFTEDSPSKEGKCVRRKEGQEGRTSLALPPLRPFLRPFLRPSLLPPFQPWQFPTYAITTSITSILTLTRLSACLLICLSVCLSHAIRLPFVSLSLLACLPVPIYQLSWLNTCLPVCLRACPPAPRSARQPSQSREHMGVAPTSGQGRR